MGVVYDRLAPGIHAHAVRWSASPRRTTWCRRLRAGVAQRGALRCAAGPARGVGPRIARNVALGLLRRPAPAFSDQLDRADAAGGPAATAERHDAQAAVRTAIAGLSGDGARSSRTCSTGSPSCRRRVPGRARGHRKSRARAAYAELRRALRHTHRSDVASPETKTRCARRFVTGSGPVAAGRVLVLVVGLVAVLVAVGFAVSQARARTLRRAGQARFVAP